jgi:hypothetical protein
MNWDALFEMLKGVFGNDPTMVLLLTVAFFFLKTIWPTPQPASQQILNGFLPRIRDALRIGNRAGAESLASEAVARATEAVQDEIEPKVSSPLSFLTGILGSGNIMPLIIVGVLLMLMMRGCPTPKTAQMEVLTDAVPIVSLDRAGDHLSAGDFVFVSTTRPWAWTEPDNGTAVEFGNSDRGGFRQSDAGTGDSVDGSCFAAMDEAVCGQGVCLGQWSGAGQRRPVPVARAVSPVDRGQLVRGQPVRNVARIVARPFRWFRLPGRPLARLFCRR